MSVLDGDKKMSELEEEKSRQAKSSSSDIRATKAKQDDLKSEEPLVVSGYMPLSFPGIHVFNMKNEGENLPKEDDCENRRAEHDWFLGYSQKDKVDDLVQAYDLDKTFCDDLKRKLKKNRNTAPLPEVSIDPGDGTVTITNFFDDYRCFYLSFKDRLCYDRHQKPLSQGENKENDGKTMSKVTTFVIVLTPKTYMDVCKLDIGINDMKILRSQCTSNVSGLQCHPCPDEFDPSHVVLFPLGGLGPYLCTQGCNGAVTHYYGPSYHAIDLQCPEGTPIVAVGDGVIKEVVDHNMLSGIKIDNLFTWNEICLQLDNGLLVDYVHIKPNSAVVTAGTRVVKGQKICESGWIGFCPLPHLHIEFHRKENPTGPSVMVMFKGEAGKPFLPVCGRWYTADGEAVSFELAGNREYMNDD